jgi:hypothetical protein
VKIRFEPQLIWLNGQTIFVAFGGFENLDRTIDDVREERVAARPLIAPD